jgi:hypothetical protein
MDVLNTAESSMTVRTQTLVLPYDAVNLNDIIRHTNEASVGRGIVYAKRKFARKKTGRTRVRDRYAELKAQWAVRILAHAREQHIEPFPNGAHVAFTIMESTRMRDPDNICSGTSKVVLDGLVKCGVLPTDSWKGVRSLSFRWGVGTPAVHVQLTEPREPSPTDNEEEE